MVRDQHPAARRRPAHRANHTPDNSTRHSRTSNGQASPSNRARHPSQAIRTPRTLDTALSRLLANGQGNRRQA